MDTNEKNDSVVKSLIVINNDRKEGYKTAAEETKDADLKSLFNKFSSQSENFSRELSGMLPAQSEAPESDDTTASGKLYRVWMDMKAAITANDRKAILSSCEYGEDVALKTYKSALESGEISSGEVRSSVEKHKNELQQAHDMIKSMRDQAK